MRYFFKFILIIAIISSACAIAYILIRTKPEAPKKPVSIGKPLVEVINAVPRHEKIKISAMGTVIPAREITVQPQVSGHVVKINPELMPGSQFQVSDILVTIDDRDYKIAVEQKKALVSKAWVEVKTEKSRQTVAKKEWELLGDKVKTSTRGKKLALREPQLESVRAALASAESALKKAELDLNRTIIKSPFNAFVKEKFVDKGQYITTGTKILTLVGTDEFWIKVSIPTDCLSSILIPGINSKKGSLAFIIQENRTEGRIIKKEGRVVRLMGDMDPVGRMARLLISVKDPLGLKTKQKFPLLLDAYVQVEIQGPLLEWVFVIPRPAFRENNMVWIVTPKNKLKMKKVYVVWKDKDNVMVRGLESGDQIIATRVSVPVNGMEVRVSNGFSKQKKK